MKKKITKVRYSISLDPELYKKLQTNNKSKYIELLIYQDILKTDMIGIKEVMI